jgi:DNA-binding MarR family transcriptional regulator
LRCLEILTQNDSVLPSQLAVQLGLTTGSVTAMLDRLERLGYATRSADPADRRKVVIRITTKATRKAAKIYGPIALDGERDVLSSYSAAELHVLLDYHQRSRQLQEHHAARIRQLKS